MCLLKFIRKYYRLVFILVLGFGSFVSCKSISSSTSSEAEDPLNYAQDKLWVVVDENEFNQAQRNNRYPESVAVYYEDESSFFYVMSSQANSKTLKQAETFCKNMTKYGGNIGLPTEEDLYSRTKIELMYAMRSGYPGGEVHSKHPGQACANRIEIWISKIRGEDDYYDAYSWSVLGKKLTINNIPSNDRCPEVMCVSNEHLKGIAKIPYKTWISYWDGVKKEQEANAKSYCEHNTNDFCCDETIMKQGLLHEKFEFDENNKVIRCTESEWTL